MTSDPAGKQLYADVTDALIAGGRATRGTMMGFPCLRRDGAFFASLDPATNALIVKLPADRVTALTRTGTGESFAPNGRVFREWIAIPQPRRDTWTRLLDEAWRFAAAQR